MVGTFHFASHETVKHGEKEYVRGHVHTNTVEGYYSCCAVKPWLTWKTMELTCFTAIVLTN
jgi:hypothetical protein